jgi:hyperosmotically inducible periplasmic protein
MYPSRSLFSRPVWAAAGLVVTLGLTACNKPADVTVTVPAAPAQAPAPTPPSPMPASSPASMDNPTMTDVDITQQVKMALEGSSMLQGMVITVQTTKGDVSLTGTVNSQAQVDEANRIARATAGVSMVRDQLSIKP